MAIEALKSVSITNLDLTNPSLQNPSGQGAKSYSFLMDDFCVPTVSGLGSIGSYYRLLRIPTYAKIKSLQIFTDKALDSNAANTLTFDIGIAFSDSTIDATPVPLQGLIPTTANDGVTMTTFAAYAAANKIFGGLTTTQLIRTGALVPTFVEYNGITAGYTMAKLMNQPLWQTFGFVDGRGMAADPGGMFDIYAYVTAAAATAVTGTLGARVAFTN